jgi:Cu2+-containing amine oxidase
MTPWQEYKKKLGTTRPWDIVNPNKEHSTDEEAASRLGICEKCPSLLALTHQCKECGCFMKIKVKLKEAECPLGKW